MEPIYNEFKPYKLMGIYKLIKDGFGLSLC